jgi:hypothetical protein
VHGVWCCTVHICIVLVGIAMTPNVSCMQCQWYCMHIEKFEFLCKFEVNMQKSFSPLISGPGRMFKWEKNRGSKILWHCPFNVNELIISSWPNDKTFLLW